jgi:hypothetical protein
MGWMLTSPAWRSLAIFAFLPLIAQLQMLSAHKAAERRRLAPSGGGSIFGAAETVAWTHGDLPTVRFSVDEQQSSL